MTSNEMPIAPPTVITFTEFVLPHGLRRDFNVERPIEIVEAAKIIIDYGWKLQCEVLRTGEASFTVSSEDNDELIRIISAGDREKLHAAIDGLLLDGAEVVKARQMVTVGVEVDSRLPPKQIRLNIGCAEIWPMRPERSCVSRMTPVEAMKWSRTLAAYARALRDRVIEADPEACVDVEIL